MENLFNVVEDNIQLVEADTKDVTGAVTLRYLGFDGELAGKTRYECAIPRDKISLVEHMCREFRQRYALPDHLEVLTARLKEEELVKQAEDVLNQMMDDDKYAMRMIYEPADAQEELNLIKPDSMVTLQRIGAIQFIEAENGAIVETSNNPEDFVLTELGMATYKLLDNQSHEGSEEAVEA